MKAAHNLVRAPYGAHRMSEQWVNCIEHWLPAENDRITSVFEPTSLRKPYMEDCQNDGPFLGCPHYHVRDPEALTGAPQFGQPTPPHDPKMIPAPPPLPLSAKKLGVCVLWIFNIPGQRDTTKKITGHIKGPWRFVFRLQ